jgi:hypothetical protein
MERKMLEYQTMGKVQILSSPERKYRVHYYTCSTLHIRNYLTDFD